MVYLTVWQVNISRPNLSFLYNKTCSKTSRMHISRLVTHLAIVRETRVPSCQWKEVDMFIGTDHRPFLYCASYKLPEKPLHCSCHWMAGQAVTASLIDKECRSRNRHFEVSQLRHDWRIGGRNSNFITQCSCKTPYGSNSLKLIFIDFRNEQPILKLIKKLYSEHGWITNYPIIYQICDTNVEIYDSFEFTDRGPANTSVCGWNKYT